MEWLRFTALERHYGARTIFSSIGGVLGGAARVGLIGANGAGKSSLVRILAGIDEPDGGTIVRARDARLGYLSQASVDDATASLRELLTAAFARVHEEEAQLRALETDLSAAAERGDEPLQTLLLERYGDALEAFERHGGESIERKMTSMLAAFGFAASDLDRPLGGFSGGQRTRAALARVMLEEPDYLILDEPTNHLDIKMVRWLEDFLVNDRRACLIVSHDRMFLDRVATEIWDLERGELVPYLCAPGRAYEDFLEQKAERLIQAQRAYEASVAEAQRQQAALAELRTHGSHNYSHVRSREKKLAKLERIDAPVAPRRRVSIKLDAARRASNGIALRIVRLSKRYGKPLFAHLSLDVARGERLAIVGENGSGKSTLLKIIDGTVRADEGSVRIAEGVKIAYFSQESDAALPQGVSAVEAVLASASILPQDARALLGRIGLGGDAADKPVEAFSGGERRRIMLACLMARASDCLLLDEPTNDLDIASREALEEVLAEYRGAMLVVSHDRYLLARIAERVVALGDGVATIFTDGYEAYEASLDRPATRATPAGPAARSKDPLPAGNRRDSDREDRRRKAAAARELESAEAEVARLDRVVADLRIVFGDPATYGDPQRVADFGAQLKHAEREAAIAIERWERLAVAHEDDARAELPLET
jgi:ATP-binding cassette subfamily F protein 3